MAKNVKTKKDTFRERFSKRYPDVSLDDEDAYYGQANSLMDEFERYETHSNNLRDRIKNSPAFAEMIVAAGSQDDFDPVVWMVQNKGLDLQALSDDPDYAKKLADAHNNYLEKRSRQDAIEKQMAENMPASVAAIRQKASEMGLSDEQAEEAIGRLYQIMDDLIVGKIDPAHFEMVAKGMTYNEDVDTARNEGIAEGLSTKVNDRLRDLSGKRERNSGRQIPMGERKKEEEPVNPFAHT